MFIKEMFKINTFNNLGLEPNLIEGLKKEDITKPTSIQAKAIPLALENKDIIGQSVTGSGKTLAYLLPIFQKIDSSKREMQAIILAPTHELVMQINTEIKVLSHNSKMPITSTAIIGSANIRRQMEKLKEKPHIIVGSSGRILELIKIKKIRAHTVKTIVIDEADKLLDENNINEVKAVIRATMKERQLLAFSATISEETTVIAKDLMKDAEVIKIKKSRVNPNITHTYFIAERRDKIQVLRKLISAIKPKKAIVFINRNELIQEVTAKLQFHKIKASGIFGNASKEERKKAIHEFKNGKTQILVASDLAARGLDVRNVTHIINLDLPQNLNEYLHRAGRTGRYKNSGSAISIITEKEMSIIKRIEKRNNINIKGKEIYKGQIVNLDKGRSKTVKPKKLTGKK